MRVGISIPQLPHFLGRITLRHVFYPDFWSASKIMSQLPIVMICLISNLPCIQQLCHTSPFSHQCPRTTYQINYLHACPWLKVCFWGNLIGLQLAHMHSDVGNDHRFGEKVSSCSLFITTPWRRTKRRRRRGRRRRRRICILFRGRIQETLCCLVLGED